MRPAERLLIGRPITSGEQLADTLDMTSTGEWIVALRRHNVLTDVNVRTGVMHELRNLPKDQNKRAIPYDFVWPGESGEVLVGSSFHQFVGVKIDANGALLNNAERVVRRPTAMYYSLPLGNSKWVSTGLLRGDITLVFQQLSGGELVAQHSVMNAVFPAIPEPLVSMEINRSSIAVRPDRKLLAQVFWFDPLVRIYNSEGGLLHSVPAPVEVEQAFGEAAVNGLTRLRYLPQTVWCYTRVAVTQNRIFVLFSGSQMHNSFALNANTVHVLNWEGELIEILHLNTFVSSLAANSEGSLLWALQEGTPATILEYDLSRPAALHAAR